MEIYTSRTKRIPYRDERSDVNSDGVVGAVRNILKVLKVYFDYEKHFVNNEPAMTGLPVHVPVYIHY